MDDMQMFEGKETRYTTDRCGDRIAMRMVHGHLAIGFERSDGERAIMLFTKLEAANFVKLIKEVVT